MLEYLYGLHVRRFRDKTAAFAIGFRGNPMKSGITSQLLKPYTVHGSLDCIINFKHWLQRIPDCICLVWPRAIFKSDGLRMIILLPRTHIPAHHYMNTNAAYLKITPSQLTLSKISNCGKECSSRREAGLISG